MAYLDLTGFRLRTLLPPADVDLVESKAPGFIEATIASVEDEMNSRLRKRYAAPFNTPVPPIVLGWVTAIVTPEVYWKKGINPGGPLEDLLTKKKDDAEAKIKEAADSKEGLFDLPLREDLQTSAIDAGGPLGCSQSSPYEWVDVEAEALNGR